MVFKYPTRKGAKAERVTPIMGKPPAKPQEIMGLIHGRTPDSMEEWRVGVALMRYEVDFRYQVPILGGRLFRGGQLLDFLLYIPYALPLPVFGNYWHRAQLRNEDKFKLAILRQIYRVEPEIVWGDEVQTQEDANARIRKVIRL